MRQGITKIEILIGVAVICLAGMFVVPGYRAKGVAEARARCLSNLGAVGDALTAYLRDSGDVWPAVSKLQSVQTHDPAWPTLGTVLKPYLPTDTDVLHCPADRRLLPSDHKLSAKFGSSTTWRETEGASYEWLMGDAYAGKKVGQESLASAKGFGMGRADMPLISEFEPFHKGDGQGSFNTLNADLKPRTARDEVAR
ncbi:hypothetical protein B7486_11050 [cyanobacterium TDX16]|nr:hypothetical protein B7486_11050 [cyanobacterium TDX16]